MRYRIILATLLVAATSYAADIRMEAGAAGANHSATVAVHLTPAADALAGVQFDLEYDTAALDVTVEAGPAAMSAGKVAQTAMIGASKQRVLVIGFNRNTLADGVVALLHVTVKAAATTANNKIRLTAPAGTDSQGRNIVIAGSDAVLPVPVGSGRTPLVLKGVDAAKFWMDA